MNPLLPAQATVQCEPPNSRLYHFTGNLEMPSPLNAEPTVVPVPPAAVLLRGCSLRNTHRVYGMVLYAGDRAGEGGDSGSTRCGCRSSKLVIRASLPEAQQQS